jgi:uncharacterized protein YjdB
MINNTNYNNKKPLKYYIQTSAKDNFIEHQVCSMYLNDVLIYHHVPCEGLKFNPIKDSVQIDAGYNVAGFLTVEPEDCTDEVEWYSSNNNMTVNNGVIEGKYIGTSVLTIKCGEHIVEHTINIIRNDDLFLNITNLTIKEGETYNLNQHMEPEHCGQYEEYTWSSDNESVATIDRNGIITAKSIGNCNITATCSCRTTETCAIVVTAKEHPCTSVSLSKSSYTLDVGGIDSVTFTPTIVPSNTTDKITWSSNKTSVATVSATSGGAKGTIFAKSPGTATITVTCGSKSASITVTVESSCTGLSLSKTSLNFTETGVTQTLVATPSPANTTDSVTWESSNTNIATVSNGVVTSKANGTATITATCGDKTSTCSVTISVACRELTFDIDSLTVGVEAGTYNVAQYINVIPISCQLPVTWSIDKTSVATINSNTGVLTPKGVGTATITARCGDKSATLPLTVHGVELELSAYSSQMITGEQHTFYAYLRNGDINKLIVNSSRPDVLSIDTVILNETSMSIRVTMLDDQAGAVNFYYDENLIECFEVYVRV